MDTEGGTHPTADIGVYLLDALPADEATHLRQHLETCSDCRRRVDELEGLSELLAAAHLVPEPPPGIAEMVLTSLPAQAPASELRSAVRDSHGLGDMRPVQIPPVPAHDLPGTSPRPRGGGDLLLTPEDDRLRIDMARNSAIAIVAATVLVLALAFAAVVFVLAPERGLGEVVTLTATDGTASGRVTITRAASGMSLQLQVHGLPAGDYEVTVDSGSGDTGAEPAGSFSTEDGSADVVLHTAAGAGSLGVAPLSDPDRPLLTGEVP